MTARFGRNKRRAAREAVAEAQRAAAKAIVDGAKAQQRYNRLRAEVDDLVQLMAYEAGYNFHLIPFSYRQMSEVGNVDHIRRWHLSPKLVAAVMSDPSPSQMMESSVDIEMLLFDLLKKQPDRPGERAIAVTLMGRNDKRRAIGFSTEAMNRRGFRLTREECVYMLEPIIETLIRDLMAGGLGG